MRKSLAVFLIAVFAWPATSLVAGIALPNLPPGSHYQLIFVTADSIGATSPDISTYNTFVNAEAALNSSLPSTTWHALTSTPTVDADVNAPTGGLPIYNTQGVEVASAATGLWAPNLSLINPVGFDQYGNPSTSLVWTGTAAGGINNGGYSLGGSQHQSTAGQTNLDVWPEWFSTASLNTDVYAEPLYAVSSELTIPTPEPSTMVLACLAATGLAVSSLRRCQLSIFLQAHMKRQNLCNFYRQRR